MTIFIPKMVLISIVVSIMEVLIGVESTPIVDMSISGVFRNYSENKTSKLSLGYWDR